MTATKFMSANRKPRAANHLVRWVLGVSLILVVGLLSAVWIFGAAG